LRRYAAVPWVLPFLTFIGLLVVQTVLPIPAWLRFSVSMVAILAVSRVPLHGRPSKPLLSILVGIAVFVLWAAPDAIAPWWHYTIVFDNPIVGHPAGNTPPASRHDPGFLLFRVGISVVAVPVLEELFWRGWLMRWIIDSKDFERVPLGTFAPMAFWVVAILFACEHGSFWDVGLAAGIVYNLWMIRTGNLWDCILAHAVTNGILAVYVIGAGQWQYWL
jgi:CAAX prenyl protease-like protein